MEMIIVITLTKRPRAYIVSIPKASSTFESTAIIAIRDLSRTAEPLQNFLFLGRIIVPDYIGFCSRRNLAEQFRFSFLDYLT